MANSWKDRLPEAVRHADELASDVLVALMETAAAALSYTFATEKRPSAVSREGELFIRWMHQTEERTKALANALDSVGHEFARVAEGPAVMGRLSAASAHELALTVARDVTTKVSAAIMTHHFPDYFAPGVERVVPQLCHPDDFRTALPATIEAYGWQKLSDEANILVDMLDQELAALVPISDSRQEPVYLGIVLGDMCATREGFPNAAKFGRRQQSWRLFKFLVEAGGEGLQKNELMRDLGLQDKTEDALRGHKITVNDIIMAPLRVEVTADGKGVWKITSVPGRKL